MNARLLLRVLHFGVVVIVSATASGQDAPADQRKKVLELMKRRVGELRGVTEHESKKQEVKFASEPILRFTEPARERLVDDGTLWRLGDKNRPRAVVAVEFLPQRKTMTLEFASLSAAPIQVDGGANWRWTPPAEFKMSEFQGVPKPSRAAKVRLLQMKKLAREFEASEDLSGVKTKLRLMPQPLCRYGDFEQDALDGALFASAHGTNPELIIVIKTAKDGTAWRYGLQRLSSAEIQVELDGDVIWKRPGLAPHDPKSDYFSVDEAVSP